MIELTELGNRKIYVNENKIVHLYFVEKDISWNKESYTQILLENCSLQVKELPKEIAIICNNKK